MSDEMQPLPEYQEQDPFRENLKVEILARRMAGDKQRDIAFSLNIPMREFMDLYNEAVDEMHEGSRDMLAINKMRLEQIILDYFPQALSRRMEREKKDEATGEIVVTTAVIPGDPRAANVVMSAISRQSAIQIAVFKAAQNRSGKNLNPDPSQGKGQVGFEDAYKKFTGAAASLTAAAEAMMKEPIDVNSKPYDPAGPPPTGPGRGFKVIQVDSSFFDDEQ